MTNPQLEHARRYEELAECFRRLGDEEQAELYQRLADAAYKIGI